MITRDFREENGHRVFDAAANDADYRACGFAELFENEEKYWWFIARKEFIKKYMQKHIKTDAKIMEVGAGTGNVTRFLLKNGYKNISVGEMHLSALDYAKGYGIAERNCFNLLDCPFSREFDCVCAFDVLEHIEDDFGALKNIHRALKGAEGGGDSARGDSMAGDSAADSLGDSAAVDSGATGATITGGGAAR